MKVTNITISAAAALVAMLGMSAHAEAGIRNWRYHGSTCQPQTNTGANNIMYNQFGVANLSTNSAITVVCPLPIHTGPNEVMTNMSQLVYFDRNPNPNQNVVCTMEAVTSAGTIVFSQQFISPVGSSPGSQQFLFNPSGAPLDSNWTITCTLPPNVGGNVSHITGILLTTFF